MFIVYTGNWFLTFMYLMTLSPVNVIYKTPGKLSLKIKITSIDFAKQTSHKKLKLKLRDFSSPTLCFQVRLYIDNYIFKLIYTCFSSFSFNAFILLNRITSRIIRMKALCRKKEIPEETLTHVFK